VTLGDIYRGVLPYVLIQVLVIAAVIALPSLATWLPAQAFDLAPAASREIQGLAAFLRA
jgi:hypothetical protein